jgi:glutathione S-transferase
MAIVFYYSPMSSATRVQWVLEELGVPYEKVRLDLSAGDQKKPDFLKINPNGKVPALVDDGVAMFESSAILIHLGEKYGVAKGLWPEASTAARAHALSWTVWSTVTLAANTFRYMQNSSERFPAEQRNALQAEAARKEIDANLAVLDAQLAGRHYLLGEHFTLADVACASIGAMFARAGVDVSAWPNVSAWIARCMQRPAVAAAMAG